MLDVFTRKPPIFKAAEQAQFQPRIWLQLLLFVTIFLVAQSVQGIIPVAFAIVKLIPVLPTLRFSDPAALYEFAINLTGQVLLPTLFSTVLLTAIVILYCKFIERRSLYSMGFVKTHAARDYLLGLLIGTVLFSAAVLMAAAAGALTFRALPAGSATTILLFLFGFLLQGMSEEVLLRGYLFPSLANKMPVWAAMLINSALFSVMHLFNPGISILALLNIFLFGVLMSLLMLKSGSIWLVCALHSAWNFVQGNLFGVEVSGMPTQASVFHFFATTNRSWINGGGFGMEGGIAVTIVLALALGIVLLWHPEETVLSSAL